MNEFENNITEELFDTENDEATEEEGTSEFEAKDVLIVVGLGLLTAFGIKKFVDWKKGTDDIIDVKPEKEPWTLWLLKGDLAKRHKVIIDEEEYKKYQEWLETQKVDNN